MTLTRVSWFSDSTITESATPDFTLPEVWLAQPVINTKEASKSATVVASRFGKSREGRAGFSKCLLFLVIVLHKLAGDDSSARRSTHFPVTQTFAGRKKIA